MEQAINYRKATFIFVIGVLLWGGGTALSLWVFDWYITRHAPPLRHLLGRFAINGLMGIPLGWLLWNRLEASARAKPSRSVTVMRGVLFATLMLCLVYVLWIMAHR